MATTTHRKKYWCFGILDYKINNSMCMDLISSIIHLYSNYSYYFNITSLSLFIVLKDYRPSLKLNNFIIWPRYTVYILYTNSLLTVCTHKIDKLKHIFYSSNIIYIYIYILLYYFIMYKWGSLGPVIGLLYYYVN